MLENIRENSSGIFAWGIALLIIITMAFFGVSSYVSSEPQPVITKVGDQTITQQQFRFALQNQQQFMQRFMGNNTSIDLNSDGFKDSVLDSLVNRALIVEAANQSNYQVGDDLLARVIRQNPQFQVDGQFDQETYNNAVAGRGYSKKQFEDELREQERLRQVNSGFAESSFILPTRLQELVDLRGQQRNYDIVSLSVADYKEQSEIDAQQVEEYYQANLEQFNEPEKVTVEYLRLRAEDLKGEVSVTEEDLQAAYEANKESLAGEEQRQVRHILLESEEEANKAIERINQGESFADVATELSKDPGSAAKGGDLGVISRGQMVEPFDEVAFSIEKDLISAPVQSNFGYHVIQVVDISLPEVKPFEEVREQLEKDELQRLAEDLFFDRAETLRNLVYENSDSLQPAADELELEIATTEAFDRAAGTGIAANAGVRDAAFSEEVLNDGLNSSVLEISGTDLVALRKLKYTPSQPKELAAVKTQIEDQLRDKNAQDKVKELSEQVYAALQQSSSWESTLQEFSLEAKQESYSHAENRASLDADLANAILAASTNDFVNSVGRISDAQGNQYLFRLTSVTEGGSLEQQVKDATQQILSRRDGATVLNSFLQGQRESMNLEIDRSLM